MTKNTNIAAEIAILAETPDPERIAAGVSEAARQVIKEALGFRHITLAELITFVEGDAQESARSEALAAINALHNAQKEYTGLQVGYIVGTQSRRIAAEFCRKFWKSTAMNPDDFGEFMRFVCDDWDPDDCLNGYEASELYNQLECENVLEPFNYRWDYERNKYVERTEHTA